MRILVTGAGGFIGRHVVSTAALTGHEVVAVVRAPAERVDPFPPSVQLIGGVELADGDGLAAAVAAAGPEAVIHLAGFANVGWSHRDPATAIAVNTAGTAALLSAVAAQAPAARVVLASTSEVYGRSTEPLGESSPLAPESPYGQSKRWMEESAAYVRERHALSVGVLRSFAHAGPRQGPAFALSNFARQVAEARLAGVDRHTIRTGRMTTVRDLSDVRDAARAYVAMAEAPTVDGPLNIGSGTGHTTAELVAAVAAAAGVTVEHLEDPALVRPGENPSIVADITAAGDALHWQPQLTLERTAADAVEWWLETLARDPSLGSGIFG